MRDQIDQLLAKNDELERNAHDKAKREFAQEKKRMQQKLEEEENLRLQAQEAQEQAELRRQEAEQQCREAESAKMVAEEEKENTAVEQDYLHRDSSLASELLESLRREHERFEQSSTSESDEPAAKHQKADEKNEFTIDGVLKVAAKYLGANMEGLVMHSSVPVKICNMIVKNEFVDLNRMFNGEETMSANIGGITITSSSVSNKSITKKSEVFYLFYQFGQFYLQVFPEKAVSFLEYLGFLTKYTANFWVQGLIRLDAALHTQYTSHPEWNWDQSRIQINRIYDLMTRDQSNIAVSTNAYKVQSKPLQNKSNSQVNFQKQKPNFVPPTLEPGLQKLVDANPNIMSERCKGHNFNPKGCKFGKKCLRLHVCFYCDNHSHLATSCTAQLVHYQSH